jgi:uncharacterized membrane protein
MKSVLTPLDWTGIAVWLACWIGFQYLAHRMSSRSSLGAALAPLRHDWMREAYARENRVTDAALVGNLMQSSTFLASTTLLVIGGLFALLGTVERGAEVVQHLPFSRPASAALFEIKAVLLTLTFAYAFFRFTWSLRQFNLLNILLGAYPPMPAGRALTLSGEAASAADTMIQRAARLNELAGANFTQGLRAYYFAVPLLLWLVNPWLFIIGCIAVTFSTYMMEFRSATVRALT